MEANELRIGNLVEKDGVYYVADFITINMAHNYKPIPLTPEILEKAEFVKCETEECLKYGVVYLLYPLTAFQNTANGFSFKFVDRWLRHPLPSWPQYLHQLQNLYFALTGTELNINL